MMDLGPFGFLVNLNGYLQGNGNSVPFTSLVPQGHHDNRSLEYVGMVPGAAIGSVWGQPGLGASFGANAGATAGDVLGGNWDMVGRDVSANLPPGFQDKGAGGLINSLLGLPVSKLF